MPLDASLDETAIHTLNDIKSTEYVKLGLKINNTGTYHLSFNTHNSFSENVIMTLEDKKTNEFKILTNEDSYEFEYVEGETANRFVLHFKDVTAVADLQKQESFAYILNQDLYIHLENENIQHIQIYNMNGQLVQEQNLTNESLVRISMEHQPKSTYIVKVTTDSNILTQKFIY